MDLSLRYPLFRSFAMFSDMPCVKNITGKKKFRYTGLSYTFRIEKMRHDLEQGVTSKLWRSRPEQSSTEQFI